MVVRIDIVDYPHSLRGEVSSSQDRKVQSPTARGLGARVQAVEVCIRRRVIGLHILYHRKVTVKGLGPCSSIQVLYYLDGCMKILSIGRFFLFLFFCNHVFIVFRYKKLRAALAMAKTKPINNPTARFTSSWEKSNTPSQ